MLVSDQQRRAIACTPGWVPGEVEVALEHGPQGHWVLARVLAVDAIVSALHNGASSLTKQQHSVHMPLVCFCISRARDQGKTDGKTSAHASANTNRSARVMSRMCQREHIALVRVNR